MERRNSNTIHDHHGGHDDATPSNVFADDYEIDLAPADGFRDRSDAASVLSFTPSEPSTTQIQTASAYVAPHPHMTMASSRVPSRSSIRKSQPQQNPFASAGDDDSADDVETPLARSPSVMSQNFAPGITRRSLSSASSQHFAASGSSRLGASGPSHPYTMYPQGTMARTASAATSAAVGRTRGSLGSRTGPTHPYGMYTQNISQSDDEDDADDGPNDSVQNPVPVGFGLGQTYRRVRGPEGEEQDIIGEYGHAEQLPPYTRYADDGLTKIPLPAEPEPLHSRSPVEGSDPAMPLMHQRMSQRMSMTDASQLEQNTPLLADSASSTEASTTGKKSWKEKTWKEKKQTRICGVRFSACLILFAVVAIIFAALVGTLAGYLAGTKHSKGTTSTLNSSYYDASIIPTPTNSMPSGTYALSLGPAEATQADCVADQSLRPAWDCRLAGKPAVAISVGLPPSPTPTVGAQIFYASGDANLTYGAQYQSLVTGASPFIPVRDNDNSTLGPAFYFSSTYNKVVVVPEHALAAPAKRWWATTQAHKAVQWDADWQTRRQRAVPGDKPWFCVFNNTLLEGFIYVSRAAAWPSSSSISTTQPPTTSATGSPLASSTTGPLTTTASDPYSKPSTTNAAAQMTSIPPWSPSFATDRPQTTAPIVARDFPVMLDDQNAFAALSGFPYMLKLEERRLPNNPIKPYCQQAQVLNDERVNWVFDSSGNPVKIMIEERPPEYTAYQSATNPAALSKRDLDVNGCHCQWMHGMPTG